MKSEIETLKDWLGSNDVWYDTDAISIQNTGSTTGPLERRDMAVFATKPIAKDTVICKIPVAALLSTENCTISQQLEEAELEGPLALTIAVCHEISLGAASKWAGYLATLPESERNWPAFWMQADVSTGSKRKRSFTQLDLAILALQNTEVQIAVEEDKVLFDQDYEELVVPFCKENDLPVILRDAFLKTLSVVASRSFLVGCWAMVPLGDVFNHRTCGETVHLEFDPSEAEQEEQEIETTSEVVAAETIEIKTVQDVAAGDEIFNTYGQHSNSYLLMKYGFAEPDNPNDVVSISVDMVVRACMAHCPTDKKGILKRHAWWMKHGQKVIKAFEAKCEDIEGDEGDEEEEQEQEYEEKVEDFFRLERGESIPAEMSLFITVLLEQDFEMDDYELQESIANLLAKNPQDAVSAEVTQVMLQSFELRSKEYQKSGKQLENLKPEDVTDVRLKYALLVRQGEVSILDEKKALIMEQAQGPAR